MSDKRWLVRFRSVVPPLHCAPAWGTVTLILYAYAHPINIVSVFAKRI